MARSFQSSSDQPNWLREVVGNSLQYRVGHRPCVGVHLWRVGHVSLAAQHQAPLKRAGLTNGKWFAPLP